MLSSLQVESRPATINEGVEPDRTGPSLHTNAALTLLPPSASLQSTGQSDDQSRLEAESSPMMMETTGTEAMHVTSSTEPSDISSWTLDDFEFMQVLGTGTFGEVRICRHRTTKAYFCMKILNQARLVRMRQIEHVCNEKNVLSRVSHRFIVRLYRTFRDKHSLYLMLEYAPGGELFNYIRKQGTLSSYATRTYAAEIIVALRYLHRMGIVYRDLKPENVLLDSMGHVKLTDFGFAKHLTAPSFSMCGTPEYIAPEIILGRGHGTAVDWWSLGVLIFEMAAGYPPFAEDAQRQKSVFEKILTESVRVPPHFDLALRDLITRLLMVDPRQRLGSAYHTLPRAQPNNPAGTLPGTVLSFSNPESGLAIQAHPWFAEIDWNQLHNHPNVWCRNTGPMDPGITSPGDTHNFYKYYTTVRLEEAQDPSVDYAAVFADF
jgi:protein kinase X